MNTSTNNYDALERLIFKEGLRIQTIDVHKEMDLMLVILNTKAILKQRLSAYPTLKAANEQQLQQYKLIADGTGIHWPLLDEDLSLKGFLQDEIRNIVRKEVLAVE